MSELNWSDPDVRMSAVRWLESKAERRGFWKGVAIGAFSVATVFVAAFCSVVIGLLVGF